MLPVYERGFSEPRTIYRKWLMKIGEATVTPSGDNILMTLYSNFNKLVLLVGLAAKVI